MSPPRASGASLMTVLTATDDPTAVASPPAGAPSLRIRRDDGEVERAVELLDGKWTVGSSAQCQVHLASVDVRPLQCVIVVEGAVASVTRWASGIQLNGRDFSKRALEDGDLLTVGSWEVQFVRDAELPSSGVDSSYVEPESELDLPATDSWFGAEPAPPESVDPNAADPTAPAETLQSFAFPIEEVGDADDQPEAQAGDVHLSDAQPAQADAFQDRLVLQLWTANFQARSRAKSLLNGIRAARFHADAMGADLAAMETELDLARAAYDSHLGNDVRLEQELAELRQQDEARIAALNEEIVAIRSRLASAEGALAQRTAEYEKLAADAAQLEHLAASAAVGAQAEARAAEFEAAFAAQTEQLGQLTQQLGLLQEEYRRLTERYQSECQRSVQLEQELATKLEALAPAGPVAEPQPETAGQDVWPSVEPVESPAVQAAANEASWDSFAPVAAENIPVIPPTATFDPAAALAAIDEHESSQAATDVQAPAETVADFAALENRPVAEPTVEEQPASPMWRASASTPPATETASTSFIDKYRHLLDEDEAPVPGLPAGAQPVIEEEFLSPAKAQTCPSPADDSDEALEAYMANMMRRVRGSSTSFVSEPATMRTHGSDASASSWLPKSTEKAPMPSPYDATAQLLNAEPISFEALKAATRKVPLASDLEALREIANSTARKAIHTHVQRRSFESAITKLIVAVTAMASAAYLMASAPALDNWQFWTGAATCAVGITAATQVLLLERRRQGSAGEIQSRG
jgi:hypothetical protein